MAGQALADSPAPTLPPLLELVLLHESQSCKSVNHSFLRAP